MNPRVAQNGRSFKGAAQYYLHDKKADTSDRVEFIEVLNLPTNDPKRAVAYMVDTAEHSDELKVAAGHRPAKTKAKPVYSYSLSWHPTESPTHEEQKQAAHETIKLLGLENHQAIIVAHNDTDHPHVHVIVNRHCPETGIAKVMSKDQLKLSDWALDYQRQRGQNFTPEREKNARERAQGKWAKHHAEKRRENYEWKKQTSAKLWAEYRTEKEAAYDSRKPQYEALWQQRENRMATRKDEISALFKPKWRDLFKKQRQDLRNFDAGMHKRIGYALSQNKMGKGKALFLSVFSANTDLRIQFEKEQEAARKSLGANQKQAINDAGREVNKAWKYDRDQLKAMHKAEDDKRKDHYKSQSEQVWNDDQAQTSANDFEEAKTPNKARTGDKPPRSREVRRKRSRSRPRPR